MLARLHTKEIGGTPKQTVLDTSTKRLPYTSVQKSANALRQSTVKRQNKFAFAPEVSSENSSDEGGQMKRLPNSTFTPKPIQSNKDTYL